MTSFAIALYGQCCRRHVVGQQIVSDISVALHVVIKRQFLCFIFAVFQFQYIAEILPLPHLENKRTTYGNSTSGFEFELLFTSSLCNFTRT